MPVKHGNISDWRIPAPLPELWYILQIQLSFMWQPAETNGATILIVAFIKPPMAVKHGRKFWVTMINLAVLICAWIHLTPIPFTHPCGTASANAGVIRYRKMAIIFIKQPMAAKHGNLLTMVYPILKQPAGLVLIFQKAIPRLFMPLLITMIKKENPKKASWTAMAD